jgi:acyl-coenzyme A thioesterase PaaI-like protein
MVHEIENVFDRIPNYNCFACGPRHSFGLKLKFYYDDETDLVFTRIGPLPDFAGFPGILHGGIQATILDELAFWGTYHRFNRTGFTYDLKIRYRKKCPSDKPVIGKVKVNELQKKLSPCECRLESPDGEVCYTKADIRYYLPSKDPRKNS